MAFNSFMHERNIYKQRPDFLKIATDYPEFRKYAVPDYKGKFHVDFTDTAALRMLTKVLLKKDFNLDVEIPEGFLIPTIPQRLNYILWIEDLLTVLPLKNEVVSAIDIGTGPCAIFSLLGAKKNGWNFVSTETADDAIKWADKNIKANNLDSNIKIVKVSKDSVLHEIMTANEKCYDFCLCNPPFFENMDDIRKKDPKVKETIETIAKKEEIFSEGGEAFFVERMIKDSLVFKNRISLYTSMFGKKKSYLQILKLLRTLTDITYFGTEFCQGNTIRWGIAWTFLKSVNFEKLKRPKPKKPAKAKPPYVHLIPRNAKDGIELTVEDVSESIQSTLIEFEIQYKVIKSAENYLELDVTSNENTWSHQRRKRREQLKSKIQVDSTADIKKEVSPSTHTNMTASNIKLENVPQSTPKALNICANTVDSCSNYNLTEKNVKLPYTNEILGNAEDPKTVSFKMEEDKPTDKTKATSLHCKSEFNIKTEHNLATATSLSIAPSVPNENSSVDPRKRKAIGITTMHLSTPDEHQEDFKGNVLRNASSDAFPDIKRFNDSRHLELKSDWNSERSPKKIKMDLSPLKFNQQNEDTGFEVVPLLFCSIKLRKTKDHILLEMNCPPNCNRETMHQIFQLFKNKFS